MIRATKIQAYLRLLERRGIAPRRLLAGTGISLPSLAQPGYGIELEQHHGVVANLMRLTQDPGIAFETGEVFDIGDLGILGYALMSSKNMRDAWTIWIKYSYPLVGSPLRLALTEHDASRWSLAVVPLPYAPELQRFYIEEFLVSGVRLFGMLASQPPQLQTMSFAYVEPAHRPLYERWFGCALEFDAPQTVIRFGSPGLDMPIRTRDAELHQLCAQQCQQILRQLPRRGGVGLRLRSLFLTQSSELPDIATASVHLGVSERTLRRRLGEDGGGYRRIKHEFRLDLARQYLESGELTLKEISYLLGYASPSAFGRAFKAWTGHTPKAYLRRLLVGPGATADH
jgi:AraC-like DNA-binding protein